MSGPGVVNPLVLARLRADLQRLLGAALDDASSLDGLAGRYARLAPVDQHFLIRWIEIVARSNREIACLFAGKAPDAVARMDRAGVEAWLLEAMEAFDQRGLGFALDRLNGLDAFVADYAERSTGAVLEESIAVLRNILTGLSGRALRIDAAEAAYTDTESVFLPAVTSPFHSFRDNFKLLKARLMYLWAETWYGTWRVPIVEQLVRMSADPRALEAYHALERTRLDAVLGREFAGMARDTHYLHALAGNRADDAAWRRLSEPLLREGASAEDSLALLEGARELPLPERRCYHGQLFFDRIRQAQSQRVARERAQLRALAARLRRQRDHPEQDAGSAGAPGREVRLADGDARDGSAAALLELRLEEGELRDEARGLVASILQDFGRLPDQHLLLGGEGDYRLEEHSGPDVPLPDYAVDDQEVVTHAEWDYTRNRFRNAFCSVRELPLDPVADGFVPRTRAKYSGALASLRRTFEAVRGELKLHRRQLQGEDVDLDALVEACADRQAGRDMSERLYTRMGRDERNVAVMFMVDMSGSTRGWVNEAEKESLVLLCEALETLGDRYAIYGFSGRTRKRCEIYCVKRFDERYDETVQGRIAAIAPKTYTRMGVAIRHLSALLNQVPARTKLLVTLSDGKPEDYGGYRGRYGVEDTRHALLEARRDGVHPYCITLDREARDYLPHMYGPASYAIVDEVHKLPLKVADIYRRLTT